MKSTALFTNNIFIVHGSHCIQQKIKSECFYFVAKIDFVTLNAL